MTNLNKTICKFDHGNIHYEVDWLIDATCQPDQIVCDIYTGIGKDSKCVGQIMARKADSNYKIKLSVLKELGFKII